MEMESQTWIESWHTSRLSLKRGGAMNMTTLSFILMLTAQNSLSHPLWSKNGLKPWCMTFVIFYYPCWWSHQYEGIATVTHPPNTQTFDPSKHAPSLLSSGATPAPSTPGNDLAAFASIFLDIHGLIQGVQHVVGPVSTSVTPSSFHMLQNVSTLEHSPTCPSPSQLTLSSSLQRQSWNPRCGILQVPSVPKVIWSWHPPQSWQQSPWDFPRTYYSSQGCCYSLVQWTICKEVEDCKWEWNGARSSPHQKSWCHEVSLSDVDLMLESHTLHHHFHYCHTPDLAHPPESVEYYIQLCLWPSQITSLSL